MSASTVIVVNDHAPARDPHDSARAPTPAIPRPGADAGIIAVLGVPPDTAALCDVVRHKVFAETLKRQSSG